MQGHGEQPPTSRDDHPVAPAQAAPQRLQRLEGDGRPGNGCAAPVRLRREFKGPTVREPAVDEAAVSRLPGRMRCVLAAIERGDLLAAERVLDTVTGRMFAGPWQQQRRQRRWWLLAVIVLALAGAMTLALRG